MFERLIDHAPLFPPASLDLAEALEEDRRALESEAAFALARFVCPASRLRELPESGRALSVVLDGPLEDAAHVDAVEARYRDNLGSLSGLAPEIYVEIPPREGLDARLDEIAAHGFAAKVRCGGEATPSVAELAEFVRACRVRDLPFKATAGLHHAVRAKGDHGLLNLLAAVVFGDEESALEDEEPDAFRVDRDGFGWRGRVASAVEVTAARRERLRSIGSCSFFEPMEELAALGAVTL